MTLRKNLSSMLHGIWGGAFVSAICAVICFWVSMRNNDFPVNYHPDEGSKAAQLIAPGEPLNFNHPLLMLQAARATVGMFPSPGTTNGGEKYAVVRTGRYDSAMFAAAATFALCIVGFCSHGVAGAALVGCCVGLCPQLVIYAHYFKEDTALIFGICATVAMARINCLTMPRPASIAAAALLGCAAGLAASAKYVGAVFLLPAVFTLLVAHRSRWRLAAGCLVALILAGVTTFVAINRPAFARLVPPVPVAAVWQHVLGEVEHGTTGQSIVALSKPNAFCLSFAAASCMPHIWVLLAAGAIAMLRGWKYTAWTIAFAGFGVTSIIALSMCAIPFARYALPITVLAYLAAAQGAMVAIETLSPRWRTACIAAVVCIVVALQGFRCYQYDESFRDDSRERLREWVATLPRDAVVLADAYSALGYGGDPRRFPNQAAIRCTLRTKLFAVAYLDQARPAASAGGVYVVIASPAYERFFALGSHGSPGDEATFERYKAIYASLFSQSRVVWKYVPVHPAHAFTDPEIYVFELSPPVK